MDIPDRRGIKEVISERPVDYIWKNLRYFLDVNSVMETLYELHKSKHPRRADLKKQARQLAFCIRQAEEYFRASSQIGIATKPTLLYYGGVSLSRALILLRQDGSHSFDALRKSTRHNHHGLLLSPTAKQIKASKGEKDFFGSIECRCNTHHENPNCPWGNFPLFYDSLAPPTYMVRFETTQFGYASGTMDQPHAGICINPVPINSLIGRTFDCLSLMKALPDLADTLNHFGIRTTLAGGSHEIQVTANVQREGEQEKLVSYVAKFDFAVDRLSPEQREKYKALVLTRNPAIRLEQEFVNALLFSWTKRVDEEDIRKGLDETQYIPNMTSDVNGKLYYILAPEEHLVEPAALFMLMFCFGMLSRYYPDIWMDAVDNHVRIAEIADTLFSVFYRKFPNLILDQLTFTHHHIRPA